MALPRAAAAGVLMMGLAVTAHAGAGGNLPPPPVLAALTALTILGATLASRFRLTFGSVLLLSALCQQLLHLAFTLLAAPVPGAFVTPANGGHHAVPSPLLPAPGESQGPARQDLDAGSAMLMLHAHAAAALLATGVISSWSTIRKRAVALIRHGTARRAPPPVGTSEPRADTSWQQNREGPQVDGDA